MSHSLHVTIAQQHIYNNVYSTACRNGYLQIKVTQADGPPCSPCDVHTALPKTLVKVVWPILQRLVAYLPACDGPVKGFSGEAHLFQLAQSSMGPCK